MVELLEFFFILLVLVVIFALTVLIYYFVGLGVCLGYIAIMVNIWGYNISYKLESKGGK